MLRRAGLADFSPEQVEFLTYGRGVDTTRMRAELGFEPAYSTAEAFADFGASLGPGLHSPGRLASPDRVLAGIAHSLPGGARHG